VQTLVRCGELFAGNADAPVRDGVVVVDPDGRVAYAGPAPQAPALAPDVPTVDYSAHFVMPGLIDVHTHLAYGNAKSEEDIDLYQPLEFRALRGLFFAQKLIAAGYTSMCAPGDAGLLSLSVRNAIRAGLFDGPRVSAAGRYLTTRQGLTDWYPTWIGVPDTSIGRLITSRDDAVEEVRVQVKNGVDCIKVALDGFHRRPNGELVAAFTQEETDAIVSESHRQGKKVVVHARGREATLYAARAGVDLIFHAYYLDDECLEAMLKTGSAIGPTLTFPRNIIEFTQPHEAAARKGRVDDNVREYETACANLRRAREAGVPMMTGTDSGFAVTPYGEWHAREIELFVEDLGFTPAQALRCATEVSARFLPEDQPVGVLEPGRMADFIAVDGNPLDDVSILQDKSRIRAVHLGGRLMSIPPRTYDPFRVTDLSWVNWSDIYTQERVHELGLRPLRRAPAAGRERARGTRAVTA
jgi:imidazolonepropionase-like amidohydrolase